MYACIDLLEKSHGYDGAVARAETKRKNLKARLRCDSYSDRQFVKRYRLTKELTRELISKLTPHMPPVLRCDALDVETKILVALAFYASGSYQTIVGDSRNHFISQASVSKAIRQVTTALNNPAVLNKYVAFPFKQCEREQVKRDFYHKFKMPALGCIDGTHVAIVCPAKHEERFFNRKGYHSINVMIICDSNLNILCVDASYPGSTHDSVVWANHPLNGYIERLHINHGEDLHLLGDSGYPLRPTMMTPISEPRPDTPEQYYQGLHLTARNVVERCIGVLKARFRCLLVDRKLHYTPRTAGRIVNACCVLHNIAHRARIPYTPLTAEEAARERQLTQGADHGARQERRRGAHALSELELGRARQRALIQRLWTNRRNQLS